MRKFFSKIQIMAALVGAIGFTTVGCGQVAVEDTASSYQAQGNERDKELNYLLSIESLILDKKIADKAGNVKVTLSIWGHNIATTNVEEVPDCKDELVAKIGFVGQTCASPINGKNIIFDLESMAQLTEQDIQLTVWNSVMGIGFVSNEDLVAALAMNEKTPELQSVTVPVVDYDGIPIGSMALKMSSVEKCGETEGDRPQMPFENRD